MGLQSLLSRMGKPLKIWGKEWCDLIYLWIGLRRDCRGYKSRKTNKKVTARDGGDSSGLILHITLPTKVRLVKATVFPVVIYGCESWTVKKVERWRIEAFELPLQLALEKTLESPVDCKKIQPVHPKGNHSWIFIGRTDAEAEAPILWWPPDAKNWLTGKDPDAGNNWRQEKETTEDEMVWWHHWLDGPESEQASGGGDGQRLHAAVHVVTKSQTWLSDSIDWF